MSFQDLPDVSDDCHGKNRTFTKCSPPCCLPIGMFGIFGMIRVFSPSGLRISFVLHFACVVMANYS